MDTASSDSSMARERYSPAPSTATSTGSTEAPIISMPGAYIADEEKAPDETSKLRTLMGILRKSVQPSNQSKLDPPSPIFLARPAPRADAKSWYGRVWGFLVASGGSIGHSADAAVEYWNYLDRPETFISIGDSEDELGRMLAVLRFWFTKDLKYVKGKPCKPYNSTLGEFFRCNWEVEDSAPPVLGAAKKVTATTSTDSNGRRVRVSYLTEQTSHHPPVSAFYVDCPAKGITARGFDQLSAKFTGTSIRVTPGAHNLGIFITVQSRDNEEYQLTHPSAHLGGLIRGSLSVTVADTCFITCPKTKIKVILHYQEESWLGKTQNRVLGVIYTCDPQNDDRTRIKDVPEKDILARLEGCWTEKVHYTLSDSKEPKLLVDLNPLFPVPKIVPPPTSQLPNESQRFWDAVTSAILNKQYAQATKLKQGLEERQRVKAAERAERNEEWRPRFFEQAVTPDGKPELTDEGKKVLKGLQAEDWHLAESTVTGA